MPRCKTKYMKMDRMKSQATATLAINNELQFNEVTEFKYLGSVITPDNMVALQERLNRELQQEIDAIFLFETF